MRNLAAAITKKLKSPFKKTETKPAKKTVLGAKYAKSASIVLNKEAGGACSAMDLQTLQLYQLDGLAAEIFARIDAKSTVEQICTKLSKQKDVEMKPLLKEAEKFIKFLISKKLIVPA